jgi:predicted Zn-dependent protease with MMP-like domain
MIELSRDRFEEMVADALDGLPPELSRVMRNVVVVVEDGADLNLLGLYEGIPLTERLSDYSAVLPDKITIFRNAICAMCDTEQQVVDEVRTTVVHEVGHHFGIDDERLHELGW